MKGANHAELCSGFAQSQLTCLLESWIRPPSTFSLLPRNEPNPQRQIQIWLQVLMAWSWWTLQFLYLKHHEKIKEWLQMRLWGMTEHQSWFRATTGHGLTNFLLSRQMYSEILFWSPFDDCQAFTLHFCPSQITQDPRSAQTLHIQTDGGPYYFPNAFFAIRVACILDLTPEMAHFLHISWLNSEELAVLGLQGGMLISLSLFWRNIYDLAFAVGADKQACASHLHPLNLRSKS